MTTYYKGNNMQLTFDGTSWSIGNIAQNFIDPNTFSSPDPVFPTVPETPETDTTTPETDPCPPGYIYDNTLKQCVPDPNYVPSWLQQQRQNEGGGDNNFSDTNKIPSNEQKEEWIANKDAKSYIDNLKERGFVKTGDDGKLYFKKDNLGSALAGAALSRFGLGGEVGAKTNKIIQDLQRMGAIDSSNIVAVGTDENGEPILDFASDLEISETPGTFGTYIYEPGTAETGFRPGKFTGVTGTTGVTATSGESGFDTWTNYINAMMSSSVTTTGQENIASVQGKTLDQITQEIAEEKSKKIAEKKQAEADIAKMEAMEKGQSFTDDKGDTYTKVTENQTGGGASQGYSYTPKDPKPVKDKQYSHPAMGGQSVTVGPRAGVMAQPKPKPKPKPSPHSGWYI